MASKTPQRSREDVRSALRAAVVEDFIDNLGSTVGALQLARCLGVSLGSVLTNVRRGALVAEFVNGRWWIDVEASRAYIVHRIPGGKRRSTPRVANADQLPEMITAVTLTPDATELLRQSGTLAGAAPLLIEDALRAALAD